jgi:hypothetical protein
MRRALFASYSDSLGSPIVAHDRRAFDFGIYVVHDHKFSDVAGGERQPGSRLMQERSGWNG